MNGWNIAEAVDTALTERNASTAYVTKPTFGSKELAGILADRSEEEPIEEIQLVGLCTDICVISNALLLKAFLPEVPLAVDAACCAGVTPESHRNALEAMKTCQIKIYNE